MIQRRAADLGTRIRISAATTPRRWSPLPICRPPSDEWTMRLVFLVPLIVALCISAFGIGLYAGVKWTWPVPELKGLVAKLTNQATGKDQFGRLHSYPGKT